MNMSGKVKAKVNPFSRKYVRKGKEALLFDDDFREPKLKINDDRRVQINLSALQPKERPAPCIKESVVSGAPSMIQTPDNYIRFNGKMILLTVKVFVENFKGAPMRTGEFDKAWYRLVNIETSQTLDYKHIKEVQQPDAPSDEASAGDDGEEVKGKTFTYVAGRIFFDHTGNQRWVYEQFNHVFANDRFEKEGSDLSGKFAQIFHRSEQELFEQKEQIKEARQKVIQNEEERRAAAAAAAAKKKSGKQAKKEVVEDDKRDDKPQGPPPKPELDLLKPADFAEALKERIGRPFIFGPVEFNHLNLPEEFNAEAYRLQVSQTLDQTLQMPENLCIHGYQVTVKNKTLKRATTVLKHSRFLKNMVVYPVYPVQETAPVQVSQEKTEDAAE